MVRTADRVNPLLSLPPRAHKTEDGGRQGVVGWSPSRVGTPPCKGDPHVGYRSTHCPERRTTNHPTTSYPLCRYWRCLRSISSGSKSETEEPGYTGLPSPKSQLRSPSTFPANSQTVPTRLEPGGVFFRRSWLWVLEERGRSVERVGAGKGGGGVQRGPGITTGRVGCQVRGPELKRPLGHPHLL